MASLKKQVLGNGDIAPRADSAPPVQTRSVPPPGLKGLGSEEDVDSWVEASAGSYERTRQKSAPESMRNTGMKLQSQKKSLVEDIVEADQRKSIEDETSGWPEMEDWGNEDDKDDGWGFDVGD